MTTRATSTHAARQRALVLLPLVGARRVAGGSIRSPDLRLQEAAGLAEALDLEVVAAEAFPLRRFDPGAFIGRGRLEDLKARVEADAIDVLIVDAALTPVQQRNLEQGTLAKVVDRTGLILEIFGRRARTKEGRLQVELARLGYERSRLVRTWTHLERQRGGLGKTGGPGETQIELDRRLIAQRIEKLKVELEEVRRTRGLQRRARRRAGYPAVVLVGYTNAGKSSLFNRLTEAGVLAKDMPFATLDPTARLVRLPSGRSVMMSDTVGFITDLPTELVASFRATLEEVTAADLLVHVRDIAHPETDAQRDDVIEVLAQLADGADVSPPPIIEAWNKIDLLGAEQLAARMTRAPTETAAINISAETGEGIAQLLDAIDRLVFGAMRLVTLRFDPSDGAAIAELSTRGRVVEKRMADDGMLDITVELPAAVAATYLDREEINRAPLAAE
ncbi:MAG: GTPase HflX [Hyphomonadaceae bacterium]|nr:MAG: GTP-binding protein HflX [Caulobacteraceae bacterium]MBT9445116.1 GTPase HflX [Hyphomonadaceae bacterium]TPW08440.1 MAG: GTP-binding protein HflX [Alphaproteobacteria bacterium]